MYCSICNKYRKFKISYFLKKLSLSIVYSKCGYKFKKISKEEEPIKILKVLGLIKNIEEYWKINNHSWRKYESGI